MYRALTSFSGTISMAQGEVREISDSALVKDLLDAGYIEKADKTAEKPKAKKSVKK